MIISGIDLNLDSTPITTWLAQQRQQGELDLAALRRSLIARMIWQASYQRSPGLIDNVAYLMGWRAWGKQPRGTLAADILALRRALAAVGHHLAYSNDPQHKGYYVRGRPALDPALKQGIHTAISAVDPVRIARLRRLTPAQRFAMGMALTEARTQLQAARLQFLSPRLSKTQALRIARLSNNDEWMERHR